MGAVADLRKGLSDSINVLEGKLKQDMDTDQQNLEQKILLIQNKNDVNLNKITALETSGPETTKTLLDNFEGQFKDLRNVTDDKVNEIEGLLSKNTETIKFHASQIEIHSENINSFVSSNAVFSSQISAVETKSDDFIKYLEVERQRIDNIGSDIKNLDENLGKAVPEIKKNSDKLLSLDVHIENFNEFIQNTNKRMVEINISLGSVNEKLQNNDQITEEINGVLEQHQDDIKLITSELESLKKSVSNSDTNHLESVEKMKELTILISNIKEQIIMQEEKITEKSTNDFNEMKSQIQVIQNDQDMSSKKIKELDNGSQSLLEKLISLEKDIGERCDDLDKTDENLLSMITKLGNDNNTQVEDLKTDFSFRINDLDKRSVENDHSTKTEITLLKHDLESVVTQNTLMLTKISGMDNGNQQMLEKLLSIETDFNGKVVGISDNTEDLKLMIINVDSETKNNSQGLINIQESLNIQVEQVKKVESERQKSAEESNKTFVDKIDANAMAVADLRKGLSDSINILEVKLKQDMDTDQQKLEQKIVLIQNKNDVNLNKITALETSGPETTKTLLDNFEGQFKDLRNITDDKVIEIEGLLSKNTETIKVHASQIEIHSENINSFVSSNAVFSSQISAVETKSDDFIKYLEVERQRIDNIGSDIKNLDENLGKAVPEIKKNSDKLLSLDVHIENFNEFIQNTNKRMAEINI